MKRAAASAFALTLAHSPSTAKVVTMEIAGRQQVMRVGLYFAKVGHWRRSVYQQLDGDQILADDCCCVVDWPNGFFTVRRSPSCPIDQHKIKARGEES